MKKPQIFVYWGPGTYLGGRTDVVVMFQKNYYEYHQWITFEYLDSVIKANDVLLFPGGEASECMEYLKSRNEMTAEQVRNKIQTYINNGVHYLGICAGSYFASTSYEGFEYLDIFDYFGDRNGSGNTGRVDLDIISEVAIDNGGEGILFKQGPVFYLSIPEDYQIIATYSHVPTNEEGFSGINGDKFIGTPAILFKDSDAGKILLFNVHYEKGNQYWTAYRQFFKIFDTYIRGISDA